jgi:hypothetical protein
MPNWCQNEVTFSCDNPEVFKKFIEVSGIEAEDFKFNNLLPIPTALTLTHSGGITINGVVYTEWYENADGTQTGIGDDQITALYEEYGAANWYDWCLSRWGCKWDAHFVEYCGLSEEFGEARLSFDTAWNPPEEIYAWIRRNFPEIHINWFYKEEGMQIAGWLNDDESCGSSTIIVTPN